MFTYFAVYVPRYYYTTPPESLSEIKIIVSLLPLHKPSQNYACDAMQCHHFSQSYVRLYQKKMQKQPNSIAKQILVLPSTSTSFQVFLPSYY